MPTRPEIFISAASRDLKSCRQLVRDALLTLGCVPVVQDHFPPGAGEVRAMLRERIAACQAVIHLAGECYGHEPQERLPSEPRRSYTQLEYDIARELKKPLYTFLCAPDFPYDAYDPEPADLRALQDAHRAALAAGDHLYVPIHDTQELGLRVRELQTRVDSLARDLQRTRGWLGRGIAVAVAALFLIAGLLYGVKRQGEAGQRRAEANATQAKADAARANARFDRLQKLIVDLSKTTTAFKENFDRNALATADPAKSDPVAVARAETARELGISTEALEKKLADERTDLHVLYAQVKAGSTAAQAKAADWQKLKRQTLTKLGDAEMAAGHYAAALEPYRQAQALADKDREPLVWCDATENLETATERAGQYTEAEPMMRGLVDTRTTLQGREHIDTLRCVSNLADVLEDEDKYAETETLRRRCLEAYERICGKEHRDTLGIVLKLANVLAARADYAGAETLYRRCLEACERTLGKDDSATVSSALGLANVLNARGDYAEAEILYRRCVATYERTLGKEDSATLSCVFGLANALEAEGDHVEARTLYCRVLEIRERTLGKENLDTLQSVQSVAGIFYDKGDYAGAEVLYRRVLEARERLLPKKDLGTANSAGGLANVLFVKGDLAGAEVLYRRALEIDEHVLGKEHRNTAFAAARLSDAEREQGKLREALPLAEEALAAAKASLPKDHPDRLQYEKNLADLRARLAASPTPEPTGAHPVPISSPSPP